MKRAAFWPIISVLTSSSLCVFVIAACNAITGSGDLEVGASAIGDEGGQGAVPIGDGGQSGQNPDLPVDDSGAVIAPPPTCTCVAPAPSAEWAGPFAMVENQPICPTGLATSYRGGTQPRGVCSPCQCGAPTGTCAAEFQIFGDDDCNTPCFPRRGITAQCSGPFAYCAAGAQSSVRVTTTGASCAAMGGEKQPAAFQRRVVGCGFEGPQPGSCTGGNVCAPVSLGAPNARTCVMRQGDVDCPAGSPYASKNVVFEGTNNGHSCGACACDVPCTTATVTTYVDGVCADQIDSTPSSQSCDPFTTVGNDGGSARLSIAPTRRGACSPSGGNPTGNVTPVSPTTFCCLN